MASIVSANKGKAMIYTTDKMGSITLRAIISTGRKPMALILKDGNDEWQAYGSENVETIIELAKYQVRN